MWKMHIKWLCSLINSINHWLNVWNIYAISLKERALFANYCSVYQEMNPFFLPSWKNCFASLDVVIVFLIKNNISIDHACGYFLRLSQEWHIWKGTIHLTELESSNFFKSLVTCRVWNYWPISKRLHLSLQFPDVFGPFSPLKFQLLY